MRQTQFLLNIFIVVILLSTTGCDALYRLLDKEGAEEKELVGEVVPFEPNPTVEEIQALLKLYGYSPGKVDGILGLRTRDAIEKFQKENDLKPTRFADQETWARLSVFKKNGLVVDYEVNIKQVQAALTSAGFDPGKIDGKLGPKTLKAVKDFQKHHQLKVDGKIGFKTLSQLSAYLSSPPSEQ